MVEDITELKKRIIPMDQIEQLCEKLRLEGKKVVTTNGCFDMLHPGHVYFLTEAKKQGDVLIVGINTDDSVRQAKGSTRPINTEENRALMLVSLRCVDYVTIYSQDTPDEFIKKVRPQVHANGEEYGEDCVEADTVKEVGASLYLIHNYKGMSTTKIIQSLNS